ncbi:MAG: hypothetical protein QXM38_03460 [Candidatus Aenigmatarchaeota archaeon]
MISYFLGKNPNFPYRDRVVETFEDLRNTLYQADPTNTRFMGHQPQNVRKSNLPENTSVYTLLNTLSDLIREGYHKKNDTASRTTLLIASSIVLLFFILYNFKQTAKISLPALPSTLVAIVFLFLISLFILLRLRVFKKH